MLKKIAFIGAGSMSEAIIAGIIKSNFLNPAQVFVTNRTNKERLETLHKRYNVQVSHDQESVILGADIVVLSMKPADVTSAVDSIRKYIKPNQLIISVIAGISTSYLLTLFDQEVPVVRVMPNTSASIGFSATAIAGGKNVSDQQLTLSESLFKTIGTTKMIEEDDMHTVTGISGSGPAYVYYLVEAMEEAAIEAGLHKDVAQSLITQTIIGAGEMLKHSGKTAQTLRKEITSPSGTTEAGLKTLAAYDFKEAVIACVNSAKDRSKELGEKITKQ